MKSGKFGEPLETINFNKMKNKTLIEDFNELGAAACKLGDSMGKTTKLIMVLKKVNTKAAKEINKHPFAKFFKKK